MKPERSLLRTLHNKIKTCQNCGTERVQASLCDVPNDLIKRAETTQKESDIEIDYYLYCPHCKEYSVIFCAYGSW